MYKKVLSIIVIAFIITIVANVFNVSVATANSGGTTYGKFNKEDLEDFFDKLITEQLYEDKIAGVAVTVTSKDEVLFAKTYGYSDYENKTIYKNDTMTRIGSISKLFVWDSILQLADKGLIDINKPIDEYVSSLSYNNPFDTKITVKHIMTHTAGFEDELSTLFIENKDPRKALLNEKRIVMYEPGTVIAYSNYGAAIGGLIVENVSGMSLEQYIKENIYVPLGMIRSTFLEPARNYFDNVSYGHIKTKNGLMSLEDPLISYAAAGAMTTTIADMSKYLMFHLNNPKYLEPMHQVQITMDEDMPGITLGMMEWKRNNLDIVWHSGGNETFKSMFLLIPDEDIGLFISYNTKHAEDSRNLTRELFLDTFFPIDSIENTPMNGYKERAKMYTGFYKEGRGTNSNSDKIIYLVSRSKKLSANKNGTVTFRDTTYVEVQEGVFKEVNGQGKMIIQLDEHGNPSILAQDYEPHEVYLKMSFWESPTGILMTFATACLLLIISLILLNRIIKKGNLELPGRLFIQIGTILTLAYPLILVGYMGANIAIDPLFLVNQDKLEIYKSLLIIPVLTIITVLIGYILMILQDLRRKVWVVLSIHFLGFVLINVIFIYFRLFGYYII